jgi:hypothetical protein
MSPLSELVVVLCRLWTAFYTYGLPAELRADRRAEIDSDLWEFQADAGNSGHVAASVFVRLLLGAPNDLLWRMEFAGRRALTRQSIAAVAGAAVALVLAVLWMGLSLLHQDLPQPAPLMHFIATPRPPPPPPPPPPDWYVKQDAQVARERGRGIDH